MALPANEIEFNSMVAVLKRLDTITYTINDCRKNRDLSGLFDALIDYYKEISADLTKEELKIWEDIRQLSRYIYGVIPIQNKSKFLVKFDEIDLKLRRYAKIHGYTTKTKKDAAAAALEY